ncbi:unnamed protein product [Mytilus edulis]|uniref:Chitin-binding type-2 domain-containing protein n=1 Tax=Mytilus edulis TaxID=6550 RepID=A0A8S3TQA8_MYTED|nr:unnamed protein product [Mytilus edulis]
MAMNLVPYMTVLSNLRCGLIPNLQHQTYYFQPYDDGRYRGYTLQCCPRGMVFFAKFCRCRFPWEGHQPRGTSSIPYPNKFELKSKLPFKEQSFNPKSNNRHIYRYNIVKKLKLRKHPIRPLNIDKSNTRMIAKQSSFRRNFIKMRTKTNFQQRLKVFSRKSVVNKQRKELKKIRRNKFRFFKLKTVGKNVFKRRPKFSTFKEPFLPMASIDNSANLHYQHLDFVHNSIEERLSRTFHRNTDFLQNVQRTLHSTIPFESALNSNVNGNNMRIISDQPLTGTAVLQSNDNSKPDSMVINAEHGHTFVPRTDTGSLNSNNIDANTVNNILFNGEIGEIRNDILSESVFPSTHSLENGLSGNTNIFDINSNMVDGSIHQDVISEAGIESPSSFNVGSPETLNGINMLPADAVLPNVVTGTGILTGSNFGENNLGGINPGVGSALEGLNTINGGHSLLNMKETGQTNILKINDLKNGHERHHASSSGNLLNGLKNGDVFLKDTTSKSNDHLSTFGPGGLVVGQNIVLQNANLKKATSAKDGIPFSSKTNGIRENLLTTADDVTALTGGLLGSSSDIFFPTLNTHGNGASSFGLDSPNLLNGNQQSGLDIAHLGTVNIGEVLREGLSSQSPFGNTGFNDHAISSTFLPVAIGNGINSIHNDWPFLGDRTNINGGWNIPGNNVFNKDGAVITNGMVLTKLAEFVDVKNKGNTIDSNVGLNNGSSIQEKTVILSHTNKIPEKTLFHQVLPEFIPPKPKIPVSLQKVRLELEKKNTQTFVFSEPLPTDICLGCKMDGGVGYTNHPTSCDRFVVCYPTDVGILKPVTQLCSYGLFWSQSALPCRLTKDVYCPHEVCKSQTDKYQYASKRTCRSYWECQGGISEPRCCPWGHSYLDGRGCIEDSTCEIPDVVCSVDHKSLLIEWGGVCDKRPVLGKRNIYERRDGRKWIKEKCPHRWTYQIELCECAKISDIVPSSYTFEGHTCVPEIYLPFTNDFSDHSGNNVYVRVDNASLTSGAACFDGKSAIAIPAFANMDYGGTFHVHVRYKHRDLTTNLQSLIFNGDCNKTPTMIIGTKMSGNHLSLLTNLNEEKKMWVSSKRPLTDWRDVWLKFERGELILQTNDHTNMAPMNGAIARSECGMKIGWGKGYDNFIGCIDEVSIHRCHPQVTVNKS